MKLMSNKRVIYTAMAIAIVLAVVCCALLMAMPRSAFAFTTSNMTSGAVDIGDILLEGYADRADGKVFNGESMAALYEKLTGKTGAEIGDVDALGTLTAKQIRAKNGNKDIVLTMDGQKWTVTHLTKDNSGNTIATLWQATESTTHTWNPWYENVTTYAYPSNMYSTSFVRADALNSGGNGYVATKGATTLTKVAQKSDHKYAKLTMPSVKGSLTDFIVKPSAVAYQGNQNNNVGGTIGNINYTLPNEAYGTPSGTIKWYNANGRNMDYSGKSGYADWKEDYIWLPSLTETGRDETTNGIWALSNNQRSNSTNSWLRSGYNGSAGSAYILNAAGSSFGIDYVTISYAVRPALHLNLDSAALSAAGVGFTPPQDFEVTYNGSEQGIAAADWYSEKVHGDGSLISVSYSPAAPVDAGEYTVTLTLVGEDTSWKDSTGDTDITRTVKMTVKKKPIAVSLSLDSGGMPLASALNPSEIYGSDTGARAPSFGFTYTSTDGKGYNSDTPPTAVGSYKATAKVVNECNYTVDTSKTHTIDFKIDKLSIAKPALSGQVSKPYSGVAQSFTLQGVTDKISLNLPEGVTYDEGKLTATNAGIYKISVSLKDNGAATIWSDGSDKPYEITITITKKPLNITITAPSSWKVGETPTITIEGDSLASDTTELYIYYCRHGSSQKFDDINNDKVIEGKKRTIVMPELAQGDYYIGVELFGDRKGNTNYEILAGSKTHEFTVVGKEITFTDDDIKWQYNNTPILNPGSLFTLTYTGSVFRFSIDDSELASKGVKIDTTKGTNGYSGAVQATNANSPSTYSVTVFITAYDSSFSSFNAQYSLTYTIEKAKYDLSGLSWNYDDSNPLQFIAGKAQGITLTGSLPSGLTVSYAGNGNIPVGSYTTTASFSVSDPTNYYKPVAGDAASYTGEFVWSKTWRIDKATLDVSGIWKIDDREDASTYNLPILQSLGNLDVDSMVNYRYYDYTGGVKGEEINPIDIDPNKERTFLAEAELKSEYTSNYVLVGASTEFTVGKNRYPVKLKMDIDGQTLPYRPEGYTPNVSVESVGGITIANITLTYYIDGSTQGTTDKPTKVGSYVVKATLNYGMDNNYIDGESGEFRFEIVKADIDVSSLKWQYTHGDVTATYDFEQGKWLLGDGTEARPFIYDASEHTLALIGADGLGVAATVSASGNLSEINAGDSYGARAVFTYDADCYNAPDFPETLSWSIGKATVDTSAIVWGYVVGTDVTAEYPYEQPFVYTRVSGAAVEYSVKLINLPDALKDCITIAGDFSKSEAGSYRARYSFNDAEFDSANYEPCVMPSGLGTYFDWVISPRTLEKPEYDGSWSVFDDTVHDFSEMFGLEEGWSDYIAISVKLDGAPYEGLTGDDFADVDGKPYKAYGAGEYKVTFSLINAGNNLIFSSRPQQDIAVSVAKYSLEIAEWNDNDEYSTAVTPTGALPVYFDYRYVDADGNVLTLGDMETGSYYYREVYVKDRYAGNAEVTGKVKFEFMMPLAPDEDKTPVAKPALPTDGGYVVYYDGQEKALDADTLAQLFGLTGFDPDTMEIVQSVDALNAGDYTVTIRLKSGKYCWDNGDGTTSDGDLELTVRISPAKLPSEWNTDGSLPTIDVPDEFAGFLGGDAFEYTYTDEDGNTVAASDMVAGKKYNVKATLKPEYADNFEFVDVSGNVLPDATVSTSHEFDYSDTSGDNNGNGDGDNSGDNNNNGSSGGVGVPEGYYDWYKQMFLIHIIIEASVAVITLFVVIFFIVLIAKIKKKKKEDDEYRASRRARGDRYDRYDARPPYDDGRGE